jgi:hypothetical protein
MIIRHRILSAALIPALLVVASISAIAAEDATPVGIAFDSASKRIDLATERELPAYTQAVRGSVQFFRGRLDAPEDYVTFFHDGVRTAKIDALDVMEKLQPQFAVWRLRYKSGSKNSPRIHNLAVSFIPLSPETGKPDRRVYVLLDDLSKIDFSGGK